MQVATRNNHTYYLTHWLNAVSSQHFVKPQRRPRRSHELEKLTLPGPVVIGVRIPLSSFFYFLFIKKREDQNKDPNNYKKEEDQDLLYGCPGSGQVVRIASISYCSYLHWIRAGLPLNLHQFRAGSPPRPWPPRSCVLWECEHGHRWLGRSPLCCPYCWTTEIRETDFEF